MNGNDGEICHIKHLLGIDIFRFKWDSWGDTMEKDDVHGKTFR